MKKLFTFLLFAFFVASSGYGQQIEGIAGFIKTGYMHAPSSGKTFKQIAPASINGFGDNYFLFGAEVYYRKWNNIYTVEGTMGVQKRYSINDTYAEPYCGAAHGKWGRIVAQNEHYWLYPAVGAGASIIQLTSYQQQDKRVSNLQEKTLVSPSFDASINADFLLSKPKWKEGYYYGWMLGIRAGYRASINSSKWRDEDVVKPYYMPRYANNAFYVTIAIGGGSFDKKINK